MGTVCLHIWVDILETSPSMQSFCAYSSAVSLFRVYTMQHGVLPSGLPMPCISLQSCF